jgi:hypothetical protein
LFGLLPFMQATAARRGLACRVGKNGEKRSGWHIKIERPYYFAAFPPGIEPPRMIQRYFFSRKTNAR